MSSLGWSLLCQVGSCSGPLDDLLAAHHGDVVPVLSLLLPVLLLLPGGDDLSVAGIWGDRVRIFSFYLDPLIGCIVSKTSTTVCL